VAKIETGSKIVASQEKAIRINNFKYKILKERHESCGNNTKKLLTAYPQDAPF